MSSPPKLPPVFDEPESYPAQWSLPGALALLDELAALPSGWLEDTTPPPCSGVLVAAEVLLRAAHRAGLPRPWLSPVSDSEILLRWAAPDLDVEVSAHADGTLVWVGALISEGPALPSGLTTLESADDLMLHLDLSGRPLREIA